jgi:hypothetical protein
MRSLPWFASLIVATFAVACGPGTKGDDDSGDDDTGQTPDAYDGPLTGVSGRVWMPNQGPGQAPPGAEIPVFGAVVYLSSVKPAAIPQQVYCERCEDAPSNAVYSGHDGSFEIPAIPGDYFLVIQKGQWRIEKQVTIAEGTELVLTAADTTLPTVHDPDNGLWIPKMAVVLGNYDAIEDILGKIGLGNMNGDDFVDGAGEVTIFTDPVELFGNLDTLRQFHIVYFPCNTEIDPPDEVFGGGIPELNDQAELDNIRRYVNEGGKLYVTDWSGEIMDHPFPPQIALGDLGADTVGTYDPINFGGTITTSGNADGSIYDSMDAEAVDPNLDAWLGLQMSPTEENPTPALIDPDNFIATHNYNWISSLTSVMTGEDEEGLPIIDEPKAWVIGSGPDTGGQKKPLTVTFEPTGCGRVMFSTYQTSGASAADHHSGLYPQERVLLFLIAEIGVCSDGPIVD